MNGACSPRSRHVALLLALLWLVPLVITPARAQERQPVRATSQHIMIAADGSLHLAATATTAPRVYGAYDRFGLYDSAPVSFSRPFQTLTVRYDAHVPAASVVRIDVRASFDRQRWSEWQIDVRDGATVRFDAPMRVAQYRAVLLSDGHDSPRVGNVRLTPRPGAIGAAVYGTMTQTQQKRLAPTYRLRVTRQGMVGGRTANGYIIKPNDFFVSLPSWRALSSNGGNEYMVRLSANGKSVVVPVYDVGPWNQRDDYWNKERQAYRDLPVGWPQDHAAYYEDYNNGRAEKGYVRYPTAVDIGDGAYWALGLDGAQATVDVTFLWLGDDPGPNPTPVNAKPSQRPKTGAPAEVIVAPTSTPMPTPTPTPPPPPVEVGETDQAFFQQGSNWNTVAESCAHGGGARWTTTVSREDQISHQAVWRPTLSGGAYEVHVFVPACAVGGAKTSRATYIVQHAYGNSFVAVDQAATAGTWISLGRYTFAAGDTGYVQLRNHGADNRSTIWFDTVRWLPVNQ